MNLVLRHPTPHVRLFKKGNERRVGRVEVGLITLLRCICEILVPRYDRQGWKVGLYIYIRIQLTLLVMPQACRCGADATAMDTGKLANDVSIQAGWNCFSCFVINIPQVAVTDFAPAVFSSTRTSAASFS